MNKFNKRRSSAVKCKRQKQRVVKKRLGVVEKHNKQVVAVSGKRTGKAAKRRERRERLKEKEELEQKGQLDQNMEDAPKL